MFFILYHYSTINHFTLIKSIEKWRKERKEKFFLLLKKIIIKEKVDKREKQNSFKIFILFSTKEN